MTLLSRLSRGDCMRSSSNRIHENTQSLLRHQIIHRVQPASAKTRERVSNRTRRQQAPSGGAGQATRVRARLWANESIGLLKRLTGDEAGSSVQGVRRARRRLRGKRSRKGHRNVWSCPLQFLRRKRQAVRSVRFCGS